MVAFDIQPGGGLVEVPGSTSLTLPSHEIHLSADGTRLLATHAQYGVGSYQVASNGAVIAVPGSPFAVGYSLTASLDAAAGRFYVAGAESGLIFGMAVGPTGQLTPLPGSPYASGPAPYDVLLGAGGTRLYASDLEAGTITTYAVAADGSLTSAGTLAAGVVGPWRLAASPAGDLLYVVGRTSQVAGFSVSPSGTLAPLPGFPIIAGGSEEFFTSEIAYYEGQLAEVIPAASSSALALLAVLIAGIGALALGRRRPV
jgi:DNA-binding beta-propeller fold protein YncE